MFVNGVILGLLAFGVFLATRSFFHVEQGHVAVLTDFGRAATDPATPGKLQVFGPGFHWKRPWQAIHVVPTMEQSIDLSGEKRGQTAMAEDGTVLRLDSILRFVPVEADLHHFLFNLRAPLDHITSLFTCLLRNEIANFRRAGNAGSDGAHAAELAGEAYALIRRERKQLNARIEDFCRVEIGRRYGVRFSAVDLTDIMPPDELADALNAVFHSRAEADLFYARAEADAQRRIMAAERGVKLAEAKAEAVALEIGILAGKLHELCEEGTLPGYVARRRTEVLSQSRTLYLRSP